MGLFVREPERGGMNEDDTSAEVDPEQMKADAEDKIQRTETGTPIKKITTFEAAKIVFSDKCVVILIVAAALRFLGGFSIGAFMPIFYKREFESYQDEYSYLNAGVVSAGGALSSYLGGYLSDLWTKKEPKARAWVPAIGSILGLVPFIGAVFAPNFYSSIACLLLAYIFAECWFGPAISIIQLRIPPEARGVAIAVYMFVGQMVGNIAPAVMGAVDDDTTETVQIMLAVAVAGSYGGCALLFCVVGRLLDAPAGHSCIGDHGEEDALLANPIGVVALPVPAKDAKSGEV